MPAKKYYNGFSLIELIVVISIIGIISAIGFVSYISTQATARDARRKQDLRAIATALELYSAANNRTFPSTNGLYKTSSALQAGWVTGLTPKYINSIPIDPTNSGDPLANNATSFGYSYWTNAGICGGDATKYMLIAKLENTYDSEANRNKQYLMCDNSALSANNGVFAIISQ